MKFTQFTQHIETKMHILSSPRLLHIDSGMKKPHKFEKQISSTNYK